ncbi:MAG: hypothetical protein H7Z10_07670 [Gemmatimonadaceae bacterium]|nr:hypothetical protein [Acetobacteraceae bacterium]
MIGAVTGLVAEARIAARLVALVDAGGGGAAGAAIAAQRLVGRGASGLISFGLAGGLDPALMPGTILIPPLVLLDGVAWQAHPKMTAALGGPTPGAIYGGGEVVAGVMAKAALHARTGAVAVDLESAAVAQVAARHELPFAVLRVICDPAGRDLPPAALVALDAAGQIGAWRVAMSILGRPSQVPALIALGRDAALARRALVTRVQAIGRL